MKRAAEEFAALPERAYNPFNCLVADAESAFLVTYREVPRVGELEAGVHVIGNVDPQVEGASKVMRIQKSAEQVAVLPRERVLDALAALCREHGTGGGGLEDTCVHLGQYGTRSSALLMLADSKTDSRFLFADGPPCSNDYQDYTSLLHEQSQCEGCSVEESAARIAS